MKTAEEWNKDMCTLVGIGSPKEVEKASPTEWRKFTAWLEAVQLDAWKQGMSDACANISESISKGYPHHYNLVNRIEHERDNRKQI